MAPVATPAAATTAVTNTPNTTANAEASPLAPAGLPGEIYCASFPMDGDLSEWENVPQVTLPDSDLDVEGGHNGYLCRSRR